MNVHYVKLNPDVKDLAYSREGDAAFDLRTIEDDYLLQPMETKTFKTGIKIAIPDGYVGNIRDRSGMAAKYSVHTMAGVLDSTYRGELGIVLINLGKEPFKVEKHMRIAQMLIHKVEHAVFEETKELSDTNRGEGGFGSSGYK